MGKSFCGLLVLGLIAFAQPSFASGRHGRYTACERNVIRAAFMTAHRYEPLVRPHLEGVFQIEPGLYRVSILVYPGEIIADVRVDQNCEVLSVEATDSTDNSPGV